MGAAGFRQDRVLHPAAQVGDAAGGVGELAAAGDHGVVQVGQREHRHPVAVAVEPGQVRVLVAAAFDEHLDGERLPRRVGGPPSFVGRRFGRERLLEVVLRRRLGGREVRRLGTNKAILILTDSRRFKLKGLRPGARVSRLKALRRRGKLRAVKVGRIGKNTWYVARGSRARLVFKVRNKRVREIGIADKRLTNSRKRARRFLRSFR